MARKLTATIELDADTLNRIKTASRFRLTEAEIERELSKLFKSLNNVDDLTDLLDNLDFWNY